jgi:hypothetical protein
MTKQDIKYHIDKYTENLRLELNQLIEEQIVDFRDSMYKIFDIKKCNERRYKDK